MKNLNLILIIIFSCIFIKCTVENNNISVEGCTKLQITKIVPDSAYISDVVSIIGTGFGQKQDTSIAYFNGTKATDYTSWNDTLIKVKVPTGATSGMVSVKVNNLKSNEVYFKVLILPNILQITKIVPDSAYIGDVVSIIGTGFGPNKNSSIVYFNGTKATEYTIWNDTVIQTKVPISSTSGKIFATINAKNSNEVYFKVLLKIDSNFCKVKIGNQIWMCKNLNVDHYRNGDSIPEVRNSEWGNLKTGAWCYYNNDPVLGAVYGKLYNWYAVTDPRGLAPQGWHVPTDSEWSELENYLGGKDIAGGKLKEFGTSHWQYPNTGAINDNIGFLALPGGYRHQDTGFRGIGGYADHWSYTEADTYRAWYMNLEYKSAYVEREYAIYGYKVCGFSVRCLKDN